MSHMTGEWSLLANRGSQSLYAHPKYLKQTDSQTALLCAQCLQLLWDLHPTSIDHVLYYGTQFFLAQANSSIHTRATLIPLLKEDVKYSVIKVTALGSCSGHPSGV